MTLLGQVLLLVGAMIGVFFAAAAWAKYDAKKEKRRLAFSQVATELHKMGLERLPAMLNAYAVGDYSGFFKAVQKFADLLDDGTDIVAKEFDRIFMRVLERKLQTPEGVALIRQRLADLGAPTTPSTPSPLSV